MESDISVSVHLSHLDTFMKGNNETIKILFICINKHEIFVEKGGMSSRWNVK